MPQNLSSATDMIETLRFSMVVSVPEKTGLCHTYCPASQE